LSQNGFHHAIEILINVRIPKPKNPKSLRAQETVSNQIRTNALRQSVLATIRFNNQLGSE